MDWIVIQLTQIQGGIVRTLATELRAGGLGTALLAFSLGALHALTPGHGKIALVTYFLGQDARFVRGLRVAFGAALLHVVSGLIAFLVLRFLLTQTLSITGRNSPSFTTFGYALLMVAGLLMLYQSWSQHRYEHDHGAKALTAGMGLLPCPLTISVLGFAWTQTSAAMVGLVLVSLSLGIGFTFAVVALAAIAGRKGMGSAFASHLPSFERCARGVQAAAGVVIVIVCVTMIAAAYR